MQVSKEVKGTKGAALTTFISLPGRYLVLMPTVEHVGVSRKITDEEERRRLKTILKELRQERGGGGLIARTAGQGREAEAFLRDGRFLSRTWDEVRALASRQRAPVLLYREPSLLERLLRDLLSEDVASIRLDSEREFQRTLALVRALETALAPRVRLHEGPAGIMEEHGVSAELERALRSKVWLPAGGYIVINQTEALVAIDVNTGRFVGKSQLEETLLKAQLLLAQARYWDAIQVLETAIPQMEPGRHQIRGRILLARAYAKNPNWVRRAEETLHDVVRELRRILGMRRIGHFGTLDPSASGLLLAAVGRATRLFPYFGEYEKTYAAAIRLGFSTDTYDAAGAPASAERTDFPTAEALAAAMSVFLGEIDQIPPPYSAKKLAGKPLYSYARRNLEVERKPSRVRVRSFRLLSYDPPVAEAERTFGPDHPVQVGRGEALIQTVFPTLGFREDIDQRPAAQRFLGDFENFFGNGVAVDHHFPFEDDGAVLDVRQQRVLLRLVEAVRLVDEQHRAAALGLAHLPRRVDGRADLLHARQHGREAEEGRVRVGGDQPREGGLARPRRPPKYHRVEVVGLDGMAQGLAGREQVPLPHELVEAARAHAVGERAQIGAGVVEQVGIRVDHRGAARPLNARTSACRAAARRRTGRDRGAGCAGCR